MSAKHALIIANTEYTDQGLAQLTAPGKDAEDFARVLREERLCAFDNVTVLLNHLSSSAIETIDGFFDDRKPDDLLVLYFSGHGIRDEFGSLYLAFVNTVRSRLRSTAIKSDYIREAMDQSRSKRQVVILDCCNSGAFPQGAKAELGGMMGIVESLQGYGRFVLTASDATQFAWEGDQLIGQTENSLFTHFLVQGLEGEADRDADGTITVDDLYDYAFEQISKVTPKQTPTKSASRQEGEIVLRQITRLEDIREVPLPDDLVSELEDLRPYVRTVAVQKLERLVNGRNLGLARSARGALERMAESDDSFQVRQAAETVMAAVLEKEEAEAARLASVEAARAEAEALAVQEAEEERQAELTRTAELRRQQVVQAAQFKAEQERLLAEKADLERQLQEERERDAQVSRAGPASGALAGAGVAPGRIAVLWLSLSWIFAELMGAAIREAGSGNTTANAIGWIVTGSLGGLLTAITLRTAGMLSRSSRIVWIVLGWVAGWGIGTEIVGSVWSSVYDLVKGANGSDVAASLIGAFPAGLIGGFVAGLIGGVVTGLLLSQEHPSLGSNLIIWIALGWAAGWAAGWAFGLTIGDAYIPLSSTFKLIVSGIISGGLGGAIGGFIMIGQLKKWALLSS